jgi:selenocysteine lyase/cysteine desulfurase
VIFGPNMTSLNFMLSRTVGRGFAPGDEILVSSLDHDGGVAPWIELAHDLDLRVQHVELAPDSTLDYDDLRSTLTERTRVVALAWASNAIGTIVDAARVAELAHSVGALCWVDAVHYAAHEPIDVHAIDADVLLCSPYKFCGPHLGMAYGRASLLESLRPYKVRPAPVSPLGRRFETGTLPYELLAGFNATIDYLERFLATLPECVTIYGLPTLEGRLPTFLLNVDGVPADDLATALAERGIGVWAHDSWYSLNLYKRLGYEHNAIRAGFIHYNTAEEVDRFVAELTAAGASAAA